MPQNLWNDTAAAGLDDLELLVYRSNLLGADRAVCNIYGGNTGTKTTEADFRGLPVPVLWVKGSGSDLATMKRKDFAGLRLDDIEPLIAREAMTDEEMTGYLANTLLRPSMPRQSIETLLHAFVPYRHTDHTHPDAVISIACSADGPAAMQRLWGNRAAWVDYIRPGFALSKQIGLAVRENPHVACVVMGKHGLVTWGDDHKSTYEHTIAIIQEAEDFLREAKSGRRIFGSVKTRALPPEERRAVASQLMPILRGAMGMPRSILTFDDSPDVLDFVGSERARDVSQVGAACPDHLVHVKRVPLFLEWASREDLIAGARDRVALYQQQYAAYFSQHAAIGDQMVNPSPRVVLIPGIGMINTGKDALNAQVSADLYHRAIPVMEGALALDSFVSLTAAESFAVEYWPLELYKLTLRPPDRELAGRVALVTGGASGIGRAAAFRLAAEGAHVAVVDLNADGARQAADDICRANGLKRAVGIACDVTSEAQVAEAFKETTLAYGGVDIVISNAGLASASAIFDTSLAEWNKLFDVLAKGYFLVSRAAFQMWQAQGLGGSLVYVASKNGLIGSKGAAAYGAAKAAEINLARCLAEEGGALGVRVNSVNPDAVLQGSGIWDAGWREARARGMDCEPEELEERYRQRTTLKVNVYPEDVAEAILFFASDRSAKTTAGILNVDGGLVAAYVR